MYVSVFAISHYFTERKSLWIKELIGCMLQKTKLSLFKLIFFLVVFLSKNIQKFEVVTLKFAPLQQLENTKVLTFVFSLETFSYRHNLIMIILLLC